MRNKYSPSKLDGFNRMNLHCFVCNTKAGVTFRNAINIFGEQTTLQSGKSLADVLSEIVEKRVKEDEIHSKVLCKKCYKVCTEYDSIQIRMRVLKSDILGQFKKTLPKYKLNYDTYNASSATGESPAPSPQSSPSEVTMKRVVVPASKLQPLPPDFVIKAGTVARRKATLASKLANPEIRILSPSTLNLKVTVGTSVLTQSIKTTGALNNKSQRLALVPSVRHVTSSVTSAVAATHSPLKITKLEANSDPENNDEQPMEIDEDCSLAVITTQEDKKWVLQNVPEKRIEIGEGDGMKTENYLDVGLLPGLEAEERQSQLLLGKFQILDEDADDGDDQTFVMNERDGSIIRVVSGQKLLYGDAEISLVVPEDGDGDSQDSNDESQIELQVSGDEETANAIIAAAQEQGGAFIKVESGEMYRVKSVESKAEPEEKSEDDETDIHSIASQMADGQYKCLLCERDGEKSEGLDATSLSRHVGASHGARVYACALCGLLLGQKGAYVQHLEKHASKQQADKSKVHECTVCKKKYSSRQLLGEHMNTHSGARPHRCALCGKTFASKYTHQSHLKTHLDRPRPYKCEQCGKSFLTQQNLNQHEKTHSGVKDFICKVCGKAFGTQHNLKVHGVVHSGTRPFVCGVCGKAFARRAEVRDHLRIHTGERPFSCEICGASFTQRSNLHSHRRATHLDDKRYKCQLCPKRFKRRRLLDYHVKASHTGERPLQCEVCRVTFVYPEHYKKHLRIHSGEKPFVCEVCGKSFNSRDNRNTHRFVHSDKKPYECLVCGAGYMRKQLLYHHMNTSGHLAESIVVNQPRVTKLVENVVTTSSPMADGASTVTVAESIFQTPEGLQVETTEKSDDRANDGGAKLFIADDKIIIQDGKSLNLVQGNGDASLLTLHNIEDGKDNPIVEAVTADQLVVNAQSEEVGVPQGLENGGMLRLVQVRLPDGRSGWLAVDS
ncbi:unnamed protein product, partial [Iphiclides podalirius]